MEMGGSQVGGGPPQMKYSKVAPILYHTMEDFTRWDESQVNVWIRKESTMPGILKRELEKNLFCFNEYNGREIAKLQGDDMLHMGVSSKSKEALTKCLDELRLNESRLKSRRDKANMLITAFEEADIDGDGIIEHSELTQLVRQAFPDTSDIVIKVYYDVILQYCDPEGKGEIDANTLTNTDQMGMMMRIMTEAERADTIERVFKELDADESGMLDGDEFKDLIDKCYPEAGPTVRRRYHKEIIRSLQQAGGPIEMSLEEFLQSKYAKMMLGASSPAQPPGAPPGTSGESGAVAPSPASTSPTDDSPTQDGGRGSPRRSRSPLLTHQPRGESPRRSEEYSAVRELSKGVNVKAPEVPQGPIDLARIGRTRPESAGSRSRCVPASPRLVGGEGGLGALNALSAGRGGYQPSMDRKDRDLPLPVGSDGAKLLERGEEVLEGRIHLAAPWQEALELFNGAAKAFNSNSQWEDAAYSHERASDCNLKLFQEREASVSMREAGLCYRKAGAECSGEAVRCLVGAADGMMAHNLKRQGARLWLIISEIYEERGDCENAIDWILRALPVLKEADDPRPYFDTFLRQSRLYARIEMFEDAYEAAWAAHEFKEEDNERKGNTSTLTVNADATALFLATLTSWAAVDPDSTLSVKLAVAKVRRMMEIVRKVDRVSKERQLTESLLAIFEECGQGRREGAPHSFQQAVERWEAMSSGQRDPAWLGMCMDTIRASLHSLAAMDGLKKQKAVR